MLEALRQLRPIFEIREQHFHEIVAMLAYLEQAGREVVVMKPPCHLSNRRVTPLGI
jgi:hypothetical protein